MLWRTALPITYSNFRLQSCSWEEIGLRNDHSKTGSFSVFQNSDRSSPKFIYYTGTYFFTWQKLFSRFLQSPDDDITLRLERPSTGVIIPVLPFTLLQFSNLLRAFKLVNLVPSRYFCTGTLLRIQTVKLMATSLCVTIAKTATFVGRTFREIFESPLSMNMPVGNTVTAVVELVEFEDLI